MAQNKIPKLIVEGSIPFARSNLFNELSRFFDGFEKICHLGIRAGSCGRICFASALGSSVNRGRTLPGFQFQILPPASARIDDVAQALAGCGQGHTSTPIRDRIACPFKGAYPRTFQ
jgi:hypothetical protein